MYEQIHGDIYIGDGENAKVHTHVGPSNRQVWREEEEDRGDDYIHDTDL